VSEQEGAEVVDWRRVGLDQVERVDWDDGRISFGRGRLSRIGLGVGKGLEA
jgi:hypothetical protein